jgi:hypothetical protein
MATTVSKPMIETSTAVSMKDLQLDKGETRYASIEHGWTTDLTGSGVSFSYFVTGKTTPKMDFCTSKAPGVRFEDVGMVQSRVTRPAPRWVPSFGP